MNGDKCHNRPIVIPRMFHENVCTRDTVAYEQAVTAIRAGSALFRFSSADEPRHPDWLDRVRETLARIGDERNALLDPQPGDVFHDGEFYITILERAKSTVNRDSVPVGSDYVRYTCDSILEEYGLPWPNTTFIQPTSAMLERFKELRFERIAESVR